MVHSQTQQDETDIQKGLEEIARCPRPVVFAGAGIPTASGIPAWEILLKKLYEEAYREPADEWKASEYPAIAQRIYDKFVSKDPTGGEQLYLNAINKILCPTIWDYSACQLYLLHTFDFIVTTNFDLTFEKAIEDYNVFTGDKKMFGNPLRWPRLEMVDFVSPGRRLAYLHGRIGEQIIFKTTDYEAYYSPNGGDCNSKTLRVFYKQLFKSFNMIFVGVSFEDKYILSMLREVSEECTVDERTDSRYSYEQRTVQHYAFMKDIGFENIEKERQINSNRPVDPNKSDKELKQLAQKSKTFNQLCSDLEGLNIKVLRYKDHKDYRNWLNIINSDREKIKTKDRIKQVPDDLSGEIY